MHLDSALIIQYFQLFAAIVIVPLVVAFVKSERLALDNSTQANGICHWYRLAKQALAIIPPQDIKAVEAQIDAVLPGASQGVEAAIAPNVQVVAVQVSPPPQPAPASGVAVINQGGFITMKMLAAVLMIASFALFAGCSAANQAAFQTDSVKVLAQINETMTTVVMNDGPIAVSLLCVAAPGDCPAAQGALALAQATQLELNNLTKTAQAVNAAPNTAKVSTAVGSVLANFDQINSLIAQYGGKPIDISPIQAALVALPPPAQ